MDSAPTDWYSKPAYQLWFIMKIMNRNRNVLARGQCIHVLWPALGNQMVREGCLQSMEWETRESVLCCECLTEVNPTNSRAAIYLPPELKRTGQRLAHNTRLNATRFVSEILFLPQLSGLFFLEFRIIFSGYSIVLFHKDFDNKLWPIMHSLRFRSKRAPLLPESQRGNLSLGPEVSPVAKGDRNPRVGPPLSFYRLCWLALHHQKQGLLAWIFAHLQKTKGSQTPLL